MKKLLAIILAVTMLLPAIALADLPDISGLSDQELKDLISVCAKTLMDRNAGAPEGTLIFEGGGMRMYQSGDAYFEGKYLKVPVVICNDLDIGASIVIDEAICNGWEVYASGGSEVSRNAKKKAEIYFNMEEADVTSIDDIISLELKLSIFSIEAFSTLYEQEEREEHRFW